MTQSADISIVIPTYNKKYRLKFLLESLLLQDQSIKFDTIIVDDGSVDDTEKVVEEYKQKVNIRYYYIKNSGRSSVRNFGLKKVKTKYVIFCDDDLILCKDFIINHLNILKENPKSLIHGKIYNLTYLKFFMNPEKGTPYKELENKISDSSYLYNFLLSKDTFNDYAVLNKQSKLTFFEKTLKRIYTDGNKELQFLMCTGGNISCETEEFRKVGGFDEKLDVKWGVEDLELGYRLDINKINFIYCDDASNYHISHYRASYKEDLECSLKMFFNKHKNPIILRLDKVLFGEVKDYRSIL